MMFLEGDRWLAPTVITSKLQTLWAPLTGIERWGRQQRLAERGIMDAHGRISWDYLTTAEGDTARSVSTMLRDGSTSPDVDQLVALLDQVARGDV